MRTEANRYGSFRDELRSVFERAKIPTNPAIAMEILRLADDPTSRTDQFAAAIQADAALAARVLEMANAALFAQREPVTTIQRAVTLLGLRRIRMVALGFQLVAHLDRLGPTPFDLKRFWQQSVLRACLAREVAARVVPGQADEAFLIGLLSDCGILLLVQLLGKEYGDLHASEDLSPTAFHVEEKNRFAYNHIEAIETLASEWGLPEIISRPLGEHHQRTELKSGGSDVERLSAVGYFVGSLPLAGEQTLAPSEPELRAYAQSELGLDEAALNDCLDRAAQSYHHVAPFLGERLAADLDVTELLDQANRHLSLAASDAERRAEAVEAERDRIHREQVQLRSALGQYRERAAHDPLTRLLNRGALMEATLDCIRECRDRNLALAVYFLDIDDFKVINDKFGHHVGDEVLRTLASALSNSVVNGGFAGRYGGEEFVVVVPALQEDDARQRAQVLLDRVRQTKLGGTITPRSVTCSVGAVWGRPRPGTAPYDIFTMADELMYQAKLGGKDRCCFKSLESPDTVVFLKPAGGPAGSEAADRQDAGPVTVEEFRYLALELNRIEPTRFATMRKRERRSLVAPCEVKCFASGSSSLHSYPGFVRNISTGGVGVLTTRPMIRGGPVEVAIQPQGAEEGTMLHVAGLVAFCRHVKRGIYEVGIQLVIQGKASILARDDASPGQHLDWVVEALRDSHGEERLRESA